MNEFEQRLQECLDALTEGRWDFDECVRRYPEHADELRAHLLTVNVLTDAYNAEPDTQWAEDARRRFLVATGQVISEAVDLEPSPSFFAAARVRFLLAAQRLRQEGATKAAARRVPLFGSPMRAVGAAAAVAVLFFGISTYTVATADAALPGDWQYPVKLQTERVRLALAFSDGQRRDVNLDIAEERLREIEQLASKGKIIGPGELDRLADQTRPLVEEAADQKLNAEDAARLQEVTTRSVRVLESSDTQVDPDAQEQLAEAKSVSANGVSVTSVLVAANNPRQPIVITPQVPVQEQASPTAEPTEPGESPTSEPTSDATQAPEETAAPSDPDAPSNSVVIGDAPIVDLGTIKLYTLRAGQLQILAPGSENGWYLDNVPEAGVPNLLTLRMQDQQSFVVFSTVTGDMYWYVSPNRDNRYDEVQMRIDRAGQVFIADPGVLRLFYGEAAEIPILIMQSIEVLPPANLEEEPTPTSTAVPQAP